jgi:hypothetical protein
MSRWFLRLKTGDLFHLRPQTAIFAGVCLLEGFGGQTHHIPTESFNEAIMNLKKLEAAPYFAIISRFE